MPFNERQFIKENGEFVHVVKGDYSSAKYPYAVHELILRFKRDAEKKGHCLNFMEKLVTTPWGGAQRAIVLSEADYHAWAKLHGLEANPHPQATSQASSLWGNLCAISTNQESQSRSQTLSSQAPAMTLPPAPAPWMHGFGPHNMPSLSSMEEHTRRIMNQQFIPMTSSVTHNYYTNLPNPFEQTGGSHTEDDPIDSLTKELQREIEVDTRLAQEKNQINELFCFEEHPFNLTSDAWIPELNNEHDALWQALGEKSAPGKPQQVDSVTQGLIPLLPDTNASISGSQCHVQSTIGQKRKNNVVTNERIVKKKAVLTSASDQLLIEQKEEFAPPSGVTSVPTKFISNLELKNLLEDFQAFKWVGNRYIYYISTVNKYRAQDLIAMKFISKLRNITNIQIPFVYREVWNRDGSFETWAVALEKAQYDELFSIVKAALSQKNQPNQQAQVQRHIHASNVTPLTTFSMFQQTANDCPFNASEVQQIPAAIDQSLPADEAFDAWLQNALGTSP